MTDSTNNSATASLTPPAIPLLPFFLLTYLISWSFSVPLLLSVMGVIPVKLPHSLEIVAAFGPFAAALIVARYYCGAAGVRWIFDGLKRWRVGSFWLAFSVLSPFVLLLIALVMFRLRGDTWPDFAGEGVLQLLTVAGLVKLIIVGGLVQGLGEEPGWRGIATPVLRSRYGPLVASLALFPIWLCWHLPQFLSRPGFGPLQFVLFGIGILSATIWFTLLWDKTRSILTAVFWHTFVNIARNIALAISPAVFMSFNMMITVVALVIIGYWLMRREK